MMTAPQTLSHYGKWIQAWQAATSQAPMSFDSLDQIQQEMTAIVAARIQTFQTGQNYQIELPAGANQSELTIAAELAPLLNLLNQLELDDRELTAGEHQLLQATNWGDRPATAFLRDLGQDLAELADTGMSPSDDLGFNPTAYLPGELQVIAEAANLTLDQLYDL